MHLDVKTRVTIMLSVMCSVMASILTYVALKEEEKRKNKLEVE